MQGLTPSRTWSQITMATAPGATAAATPAPDSPSLSFRKLIPEPYPSALVLNRKPWRGPRGPSQPASVSRSAPSLAVPPYPSTPHSFSALQGPSAPTAMEIMVSPVQRGGHARAPPPPRPRPQRVAPRERGSERAGPALPCGPLFLQDPAQGWPGCRHRATLCVEGGGGGGTGDDPSSAPGAPLRLLRGLQAAGARRLRLRQAAGP